MFFLDTGFLWQKLCNTRLKLQIWDPSAYGSDPLIIGVLERKSNCWYNPLLVTGWAVTIQTTLPNEQMTAHRMCSRHKAAVSQNASANLIDYQGSLRLDATLAQEGIVRTRPGMTGNYGLGSVPSYHACGASFAEADRMAKQGATWPPAWK